MAKRGPCMLLALVTLFTLAVPVFAAEEPVVTEEPAVVTEEPAVVTEEPVVEAAEEPAVEATEEPIVETTEEPVVEVTEEPVVTEEPIVTEEPVVTEVPEATEAPEAAGEPVSAAEPASGNCGPMVDNVPGDSVKWSYDAGSRTLTISGTGPMGDFYSGVVPYEDHLYSIRTVIIKDGVTRIGNNAFCGCENMTSVTIPASVTSIGTWAFELCTSLTSVTLPSGMTEVAMMSFYYCRSLTSVVVPDGVTSIGREAFAGCTSLSDIRLPASLTSAGRHAFYETPWLAAQGDFVIINDWLYLYQGTAASATVPDSVRSLGGQYSFETETLKELVVPKTVIDIGGFCFNECPNLQSVTVCNSKANFDQLFDPTCPTAPRTLELASYSTSTAHTWVVARGSWDHLTFRDLGPEPTTAPVPTATPKPASAKLAMPKITKMENTASGLKVTWGKVTGAVRYTVFYKLKGAKDWTKIGTTTATSYTRKAKDLKNGKTYVFTVRCVANDKKTYTSDYDKAGKSLTYYAPPTVKIAKASNGGIKVTWNKVSGVSRYMVYYKENGGSWKKIGTTAAASYTRAAKYLKNGRTYQFTVRCVANDKKTMLSSYKASNSLKYKK